MALQTINLGTYANDRTGDDLRTAFQKVNANLTELYDALYGANVGSTPPTSGVGEGELWWSTLDGRLYIKYGAAWVDASPVGTPLTYDISAQSTTGGANIRLSGSDLSADDIKIASGTNITVTRNDANTITLSSENYVGNVTGNISGNAGTVTNGVYTTSSINALADVDTVTTSPSNGQALAWNGTTWVPQTIAAGVSRIIAGTNVTISPTNGLGQVTINSSGVSNVFDLGEFQQTYEDPISYLLDQVGIDFGSFTSPSAFTVDGGTF
jgi:hypothetical protein